MQKFMKILNNISRSQAIYRSSKVDAGDLQSSHYAFVLSICREPGRSQEDQARELCLNKSTIARSLNYLEEKGYVTRVPMANDKRQLSVHPTDRMLAVLPQIRSASKEWMALLSEGIPQDKLDIFNEVLGCMEARAREIIEGQEDSK